MSREMSRLRRQLPTHATLSKRRMPDGMKVHSGRSPARWWVAAGVAFGRRQFHGASGERFRLAIGRSYLIRAMANAGRYRKFFRWGYVEALS